MFGLRGKGGPLGFGLFGGGRRGQQRQGQGQGQGQQQRRGGLLGLGLFGGGRRGQQGGQSRGATGFSQMSPMQQFARQQYLENAGPIGPGMDMDSYGFGMNIGTPDAAGIAAGVERDVKAGLPFEQRDISGPYGQNYYQLVDKATGNVFMQGQHHPDAQPTGPRMQRIGGGL